MGAHLKMTCAPRTLDPTDELNCNYVHTQYIQFIHF